MSLSKHFLCLADHGIHPSWPLVLRFTKGAIHGSIVLPVLCHAVFCVLIVCLHQLAEVDLDIPSTIVGLDLVLVWHTLIRVDSLVVHRRWLDARIPKSNILYSILGR